jgi:glucokinase
VHMYLGVDIGGSKTLMVVFSEEGQIVREHKFATNHDYPQFLNDISSELNQFKDLSFDLGCVGVPGIVDRETGVVKSFGNIPWENVSIKKDLSALLGLDVLLENDANLAALAEAILLKEQYKRVLYVTLSTGIGGKLIINGTISQDIPDAEIGHMMFEYGNKILPWEKFASGQALVYQFGKKASEIDDPAVWEKYSYNVARGLQPVLAVMQPEVVVLGGGVGAHFEKFDQPLKEQLEKFKNNMIDIPPLLKAKNAVEAVVYGCYELIKQSVGFSREEQPELRIHSALGQRSRNPEGVSHEAQ